MEGYAVYLKTLLEPLGIYDLTENSISGGELCALGGELDAVNGQLERAERADRHGRGGGAFPARGAFCPAKRGRDRGTAAGSHCGAIADWRRQPHT